MRLALCLHGLAGGCGGKNGAGDPVDLEYCFNSMKKNVLRFVDECDIFIHSWSVDRAEEMIDLYQPVKYVFQPQIKFSDDHSMHIAKSRWRTLAESLSIARTHMCNDFIDYDCVFASRFDIVWKDKLCLKQYAMNKIWLSRMPHAPKKYYEDFFMFGCQGLMFNVFIRDGEIPSSNNHKNLNHFIGRLPVGVTHTPPRDYDLYRWHSGKNNEYPEGWYDE